MTNQGTAIAGRVREAAEVAGLSVNSLADATGIPYKTLWRRLNHEPDFFKVQELVAITHATHSDFAWLVAGAPTAAVAAVA